MRKFSASKDDFFHIFHEKASDDGQLRDPRGITIDSKDNLVYDSGDHRLLEVTTDGPEFAVRLQQFVVQILQINTSTRL